MQKKTLIALNLFAFLCMANAFAQDKDILIAQGVFNNCQSLYLCEWNSYIEPVWVEKFHSYKDNVAGSVYLGTDPEDETRYLIFKTAGMDIKPYGIQATHGLVLLQGHSYQIVGTGFMEEIATGTVSVGVMNSLDMTVFEIEQSINGEFKSSVYNHCSKSEGGNLYINAGKLKPGEGNSAGYFKLQEIKIIENEISCNDVDHKDSIKIDDLEDGDNIAFTGGTWFAYDDNHTRDRQGNYSQSSFTNIDSLVLPATNGSEYMAGLKGIALDAGHYNGTPFVVLGLKMNKDSSGYDFSSCDVIAYDYIGPEHQFKVVMEGDYNGELTEDNYHYVLANKSSSWKTVLFGLGSFAQEPNWGYTYRLDVTKIGKLLWDVRGRIPDYLYVDNVRCLKRSVVPVDSNDVVSSSSEAESSSSKAESSSSEVEPSSSEHTTFIGASNGRLQISANYETDVKINVFDMLGNKVKSLRLSLTTGDNTIVLTELARGKYIAKISGKNASGVVRINIR